MPIYEKKSLHMLVDVGTDVGERRKMNEREKQKSDNLTRGYVKENKLYLYPYQRWPNMSVYGRSSEWCLFSSIILTSTQKIAIKNRIRNNAGYLCHKYFVQVFWWPLNNNS